ncbi:MAG: type II toxin-antitoxin system VapC family toxin [Pseudomonadota bacterium]
MPGVLLDTHVFAWALLDSPRLTATARAAILEADRVCISAVSFYQIGQKVRLGKWPEMAPHAAALPALARRQGAVPLPLSAEAATAAALLDWPHRDPFDRLIAAAAALEPLTLVSADAAFDTAPLAGLHRVWE